MLPRWAVGAAVAFDSKRRNSADSAVSIVQLGIPAYSTQLKVGTEFAVLSREPTKSSALAPLADLVRPPKGTRCTTSRDDPRGKAIIDREKTSSRPIPSDHLEEFNRFVQTAGGEGTTPREHQTLKAWVDLAEAYRIRQALRQCRGNRSAAARLLGIGRRTRYAKMNKLGLADSLKET